jgi:hypothetical protein
LFALVVVVASCGTNENGVGADVVPTTSVAITEVVEDTAPTTSPATTVTVTAPTVTTASASDLGAYSPLASEIQALLFARGDLADVLCPREEMPRGIPGALGFILSDDRHPGMLVDARVDRPSTNDPAETLALGDASRESPLIEKYSIEPGWLASTVGDLQMVLCIAGADIKGALIQECPYTGNNTVVWYAGGSSVVAFDAATGNPVAIALASSGESEFPCSLIASFDGQGETKESIRSSHDALVLAIEALFRPGGDLPENVMIEWLGP